jgi:SAM-dependent methyltransferase
MGDNRRFYEASASGAKRSAPAALRNREAIGDVLAEWLPSDGLVLEIASGSGEHAIYFAERFPRLEWQPSDVHPDALWSIGSWRDEATLPNLRAPIALDASSPDWPIDRADALLSIKMDSDSCDDSKAAEKGGFDVVLNLNMVHISPWRAALGLLDGAARVLKRNGALILYGPWLQAGVETAPSNLAFDQQLRERDPEWGLRRVEDFDAAASERGFRLEQTRAMPANNLMLLFRLAG